MDYFYSSFSEINGDATLETITEEKEEDSEDSEKNIQSKVKKARKVSEDCD